MGTVGERLRERERVRVHWERIRRRNICRARRRRDSGIDEAPGSERMVNLIEEVSRAREMGTTGVRESVRGRKRET